MREFYYTLRMLACFPFLFLALQAADTAAAFATLGATLIWNWRANRAALADTRYGNA